MFYIDLKSDEFYFIAFFCRYYDLAYFYEDMLKVLSREEWTKEVLKIRPLQLNEQSFIIDAFTELGGVKPAYFLYQDKGRVLISYIAFVKNQHIGNPFYFFYSPLWIDDQLSDAKYAECLNQFVKGLQQLYTSISIKLPVGITDIRPFLWNNFSIANHYTYVKNLAVLSYHETTKKNINKCKKLGYSAKVESLNVQSLKLNTAIFSDLKFFGAKKIAAIEQMLSLAASAGYVKSFNCYKDQLLIASNIILLDKENKIAYTVLLNKTSTNSKDDVHSFLHDFFFNELKNEGYEKVDLLGADIESIASFKSRFGATLQPHFIVNYHKSLSAFNGLVKLAKAIAKKVVYQFR